MRRRLADARVAHLATVTADGRPHVVPCCFALATGGHGGAGEGGDSVVMAVDAKPKSTLALRRLANIGANPATSLLVDHYAEDWSTLWWVRVDGTGRVVDRGPERERALALLAAKYEQYRRQPPPGPAVVVEVTRWSGWAP